MSHLDPKYNVGKICKVLEKYYDVSQRRMATKARPALIIGYEPNYSSGLNVDYEVVTISKCDKVTPDETYDIEISSTDRLNLGLTNDSYFRSHKTSWCNVRQVRVEEPIGDLKSYSKDIFNQILQTNHSYVTNRTNENLVSAV
ncbi:hypothetical protein [Bacillus mobilis]|uniref:hypothetical protein n=1 Tax=Bacillus mobilis TaxID=2026190 RepID=UPI000A3024AF|nr:hypothetical protein [Bacillus mobilis]MCU5594799.1 hypothetical protein [Bacillus mobilis]MCU5738086.1 hypothetical protein [Bacillus mobilis]MCU9561699.1 hypothetical protein [Bacillus mobilis]SMD95193.1 hypothetical protein BACERE00177_01617 [Bacillus mobilis]HDR7517148.1 hypothetical protein [Bacillus mobilis]